jgi:hypothetical protein
MNVARRLSVLTASSAVAILAAGGLALSTDAATAQTSDLSGLTSGSSPDFTCPAGHTCFFSGDNFNGNWWSLPNSTNGGGIPFDFANNGITPNPGSAHMNGGSTLWLLNTSNGHEACVYDGKIVLDGDYTYFWINYGENTCN